VVPEPSSHSRRVPREARDAPEELPKEAPHQLAFGGLEDKVPRMPDEATAGLEEPLLEARQILDHLRFLRSDAE